MPTRLICGLLLAVMLVSSGCAALGGPSIPMGIIYTRVKAPLDTDMDKTSLGSKTGEASATGILGLIAFGDASTEKAADDGGITTINHADFEFFSILGLFSTFKTIAHGD